jgi:hypothetical protein
MAFLLFISALMFFIDWVLEKIKLKGKHEAKFFWLSVALIGVLFVVIFGIDSYATLDWEDRVLRR